MDFVRLTQRDHARALVDLVYATYGLTFHRDWLYDPEAMLDLNARGDIVSVVAVDGTQVVGHLALIRPQFDAETPSGPPCSARTRECGLSIVHPDARGEGVQAALALALSTVAWQEGVSGAIMRCVTHHTWSQRSALKMGGTPTALLLGSIPRWVSYDGEDATGGQPLSTALVWVPVRGRPNNVLHRPAALDWLDPSLAALGASAAPVPTVGPLPAETVLHTTWSGSRRLAQIHVTVVGRDLAERLSATCQWLTRGHIAHVAVFLPAEAATVAAHAALETAGLFAAGWIPSYLSGDRDALVYQTLAWAQLDPTQIQVVGGELADLRDAVVGGWRRVSQAAATRLARRGRVRVLRRGA